MLSAAPADSHRIGKSIRKGGSDGSTIKDGCIGHRTAVVNVCKRSKESRWYHKVQDEAPQRLAHNEKAIANDLTSNEQPSHRGFTQTQPGEAGGGFAKPGMVQRRRSCLSRTGCMRKPACEAVACTSYLRFWGKITMAAAILVPSPRPWCQCGRP